MISVKLLHVTPIEVAICSLYFYLDKENDVSRSYKKHPYGGQRKDGFYKREANRAIRRLGKKEILFDYGSYRKAYERWMIVDWWNRSSIIEMRIKYYEELLHLGWSVYESLEDVKETYEKCYVRK